MNLQILQEGQRVTNYYEQQNMNLIFQGDSKGSLWLGNIKSAQNLDELQKNDIKAVITIASGINLAYPEEIVREHLVIPAEDIEHYNISQDFDQCFDFIRRNLKHGSVLVHCMAGVSRSASIVIGYLMNTNKWTMEKAYKYTQMKRNATSPNYGFQKQLRDYEFDLLLNEQQKRNN